jgi:hypothetical protein
MRLTHRRITLRHLAPLALSTLLLAGATSCARHGIKVVETSNSKSEAILIGEVNPIREGKLRMLRLSDVSDGVFTWGFGYGTTAGPDAPYGEVLFVDGKPLMNAGEARGDSRFLGPFAVGLAPDQYPAARHRGAPSMQSVPVADLLADLAMDYNDPILVVGIVEFSRLEGDGGLDGEAPAHSSRNADALFIAVAAQSEDVLTVTSSRFFPIPEDMAGLTDDLFVARAGVLRDIPRNWRLAGAELAGQVEEIVPVDPFKSRVSVRELDVYLLGSIQQP